jgi:ficolin
MKAAVGASQICVNGKMRVPQVARNNIPCVVEGGRLFIVFQQRLNNNVDFYKSWSTYEDGFGDSDNWWLGNKDLNAITHTKNYGLRIELTDHNGTMQFLEYPNFVVEKDTYKLKIDSVATSRSTLCAESFQQHLNVGFSTYDQGPSSSCSQTYKGGWWYTSCHGSNLNGVYHDGAHDSYADGINWRCAEGYFYSYSISRMMMFVN